MSGAGRRPRPAVLARLAAALVGLYPRSWRERYGNELLGWVDEGGLGPLRVLYLARGAAAQRHAAPATEGASGAPVRVAASLTSSAHPPVMLRC